VDEQRILEGPAKHITCSLRQNRRKYLRTADSPDHVDGGVRRDLVMSLVERQGTPWRAGPETAPDSKLPE